MQHVARPKCKVRVQFSVVPHVLDCRLGFKVIYPYL